MKRKIMAIGILAIATISIATGLILCKDTIKADKNETIDIWETAVTTEFVTETTTINEYPPETSTTTIETTKPVTESTPETTSIETQTKPVLPPELRDKNRLPDGNTNMIPGMPYTKITNHRSQQWALQKECTPDELGVQCYYDTTNNKKYYTTAMGSAYGRTIGDTFHITLKNGFEFDVMLGEFKDDGSTDFFGHSKDDDGNPLYNYLGQPYTSVLEFIYDPEALDPRVLAYGTFTIIDSFGGIYSNDSNIKSVKYTGQLWRYHR